MIRLCDIDEIPEGEGVRFPGPSPVAVFRTGDEVFVLDDACSHQGASLSDGYLEGCWVECPLHEAFFSLHTGEPSGPPAKRPVRTHEVIIDEAGPTVSKGRSKADAPQIDGSVYLSSRRPLKVGEIVTAKIERADQYDLHGSVAGF